jgi:MFS family permease
MSETGQRRRSGAVRFRPIAARRSATVPVRESNASANGARRRFVRFEPQIFTRPATSTAPGLYHGWLVVAAAFVIALLGFGVGFYGPGIYLVALERCHVWSAAAISWAITLYYVVSAALVFFGGGIFERFGARRVVAAGAIAMAGGVVFLAIADRPWQVYAAFAAMSPGWAAMSGAAINIIVAPWFDRRRGFAVSLALNGASAGGIVVAPLLILLIGRLGFARALWSVAALMLAVLLPVAGWVPACAGKAKKLNLLRRVRLGCSAPCNVIPPFRAGVCAGS